MSIHSIAGLLTIISPHVLLYSSHRQNKFYSKDETISHNSLQTKEKTETLRLALGLNGIFSYIFLQGFDIPLFLPFLISSLFLLTSFTESKSLYAYHKMFSLLLLYFLSLIKLVIGISLYNHTLLISLFSIILGTIELLSIMVTYKNRMTGTFQIQYDISLSFWVFIMSVFLWIK